MHVLCNRCRFFAISKLWYGREGEKLEACDKLSRALVWSFEREVFAKHSRPCLTVFIFSTIAKHGKNPLELSMRAKSLRVVISWLIRANPKHFFSSPLPPLTIDKLDFFPRHEWMKQCEFHLRWSLWTAGYCWWFSWTTTCERSFWGWSSTCPATRRRPSRESPRSGRRLSRSSNFHSLSAWAWNFLTFCGHFSMYLLNCFDYFVHRSLPLQLLRTISPSPRRFATFWLF